MGYRKGLDREWAERHRSAAGGEGVECPRVWKIMLGEAGANQAEGERCRVDGDVVPRQQVGERPDVVLVTMVRITAWIVPQDSRNFMFGMTTSTPR